MEHILPLAGVFIGLAGIWAFVIFLESLERVPNARVAARISRGTKRQVRREVNEALRRVKLAAEFRDYETTLRVEDSLRKDVVGELVRRGFAVAAPEGKSYISIHWNEHEWI